MLLLHTKTKWDCRLLDVSVIWIGVQYTEGGSQFFLFNPGHKTVGSIFEVLTRFGTSVLTVSPATQGEVFTASTASAHRHSWLFLLQLSHRHSSSMEGHREHYSTLFMREMERENDKKKLKTRQSRLCLTTHHSLLWFLQSAAVIAYSLSAQITYTVDLNIQII